MSPWFGLVLMLGFGVFFYKAAEFEDLGLPFVWGGGSVLLYLTGLYWLDLGCFAIVGLQLGLFSWMAIWMALTRRADQR